MTKIGLSIAKHFALCRTGLSRAPAVLGSRASAVWWFTKSRRMWIVLAICGLVAGWLLPALVTWLVNALYPLADQGIGKSIAGFFDGSTAKLGKLRAARHAQFMWLGHVALAFFALSEVLRSFASSAPDEAEVCPSEEISSNDLDVTQVMARNGTSIADQTDDVTQVLPRSVQAARTQPNEIAEGRYRVENILGTGAAGQVVKAFDTRLQRAVAIKQLLVFDISDDDFVGRFEQEARTLANLSHPHIVAVHDLVIEGGQFWIVMELLTGGHLKGLIRQRQSLPPQDALTIARDIASALAYAHERQIVHRDIKPENILRSADGVWKLTDFGIAKQQNSDIKTQLGLVVGSLSYMSPEQATGAPVDARSDIYSLGISLFEMLTGKVPFRGDTREVLAQHVTRDLPVFEPVPPAINELLQRMTAKAPEARFANCRELIAAIDRCHSALSRPLSG